MYLLLLMSITKHIPFNNTQNLNKIKNKKKYKKDYIGLLGLLQTIRGRQGKPLTGKQGQRDFDQKDYFG